MLNVHRSNRADRLVAHLAERLATDPLDDPMATEQIAVQSRGMERWLSHQLAHHLGARGGDDGISVNIRFPFPGRIVREVLAAGDAGPADDDPWQPHRLVWPVLARLPVLAAPGAERIRAYLGEAAAVDRRRWGLARRIADLLDRYAMFRPRMVAAWSRGEDIDSDGAELAAEHRWQPELWRALEAHLGVPHLAERFATAEEVLRDPGTTIAGLPARLTLFGTSQLPPSYLDVLVALAQRIDVSLYAVAPSPVLWERVRAAGGSAEVEPRHPVLVSSGRLARDFQALLERRGGYAGDALFADPIAPAAGGAGDGDRPTVLARLQSDLLRDVDRGDPTSDDPEAAPVELADGDTSVQFHVCHSPARQVEVLHDRLQHLFADHPDLQPRDVLVMAPDIETYAPLVAAVFDRVDAPIPFRIADRTLRRTNPVAAALLDVLDLVDSRLTASAVLDLLAHGPLRRRAGIAEHDLGAIQRWVGESGVRWALDEDHRAEHGQPPERHHTWRFGLDRLLLGVAMPDEDDRVYADVVPYDDMEGGDVELLGRFVALCDRLFGAVRELAEPRPVAQWGRALTTLVEEMTSVDDDDRWLRDQTVDVLRELDAASAGPDGEPSGEPLTVDAVRSLLDGTVTEQRPAAGYETGAVTFCQMIPMRSIPHRVVCLLGMDDGAFPRPTRPLGFDLVADQPATGDRDRRDEDRLLLLEALLAARDHLIVCYTGRDLRSNEERAPAVPVGELRDLLDRAHLPDAAGRTVSQRLSVEHPLQAFSPRNFVTRTAEDARTGTDAPLSFESGQLAAARTLVGGTTRSWRFLPEPLPPPEEDAEVVELADLRRFLENPTRWLCTRRLGMWLGDEERLVDDTEPVEADGRASWAIGHSLLGAVLDERPDDVASWPGRPRWEAALVGRGTVPAGTLGRYAIEDVRPTVEGIVALVRSVVDTEAAAGDVTVDVTVDDRRLRGLVRAVRGDVLAVARFARLKPKHRLSLWVDHLALSVARPGTRCVAVGRDGDDAAARSFRSLDAETARTHLAALLDLYERGQREPLPLFETSSEIYAATLRDAERRARRALAADADEDEIAAAVEAERAEAQHTAVARARRAWETTDHHRGDDAEAHVAQCFGDACPFETILDETDFTAVAETVWAPVLAAEVDVSAEVDVAEVDVAEVDAAAEGRP